MLGSRWDKLTFFNESNEKDVGCEEGAGGAGGISESESISTWDNKWQFSQYLHQ